MEDSNNEEANIVAKVFGLIFALLTLPLKLIAENPKVSMVVLIILFSVGGTLYFTRNNPQILGLQRQEIDQTERENEKLIKEVGEIIELPDNETPTIATVSDVNAVKDQNFFKNAQNGDKVLIYSAVKKAYLYRPLEKKIIEVGVVNIGKPGSEENTQEILNDSSVREEKVGTQSADINTQRSPSISPTLD
jgi:hypothetical protein